MNVVSRVRGKGFLTIAEVEKLLLWSGTTLSTTIDRVMTEQRDNRETLDRLHKTKASLSHQLEATEDDLERHTDMDKDMSRILSLVSKANQDSEGENT